MNIRKKKEQYGVCQYCGNKAKDNRTLCESCHSKQRLIKQFTEAVNTIKKEIGYGTRKAD